MEVFFTQDAKNAKLWISFSKPVKNLKTPEFQEIKLIAKKTKHPILKSILKLINAQASLPATNALTFQFPCFTVDDTFKEVKKLSKTKLHRVMKFLYIF